jgi:methyl-accepting chemotaxis protein
MRTVQELCRQGGERLSVELGASATAAIEIFRATPSLRLLPVLDEAQRPVGAIFEEDIRQILFNPYGHALLQNPSFGRTLGERIRPCPSAEIDCELADVLGAYTRAGGQEGMIITRNGRYHGVIENRDLLAAAGAYELDRIARRERDLNRLREAGFAFEKDIESLSGSLKDVAENIGSTASATALRGKETGQRAREVSDAATQTGEAMLDVADHSSELVAALDLLYAEASAGMEIAHQAVAAAANGAKRAEALYGSARSIEDITALIDALAGKVKMLAINATIEAARAGDAGRGFAIVAHEVRALAGQTRSAAEDIRRHSSDVRIAIKDVIVGHAGMEQVIAGVQRISSSVEATVQAQRAVTREIAVSADKAASASQAIRANVESIRDTAQAAAVGAGNMESAAQSLSASSGRLTNRVLAFINEVRRA